MKMREHSPKATTDLQYVLGLLNDAGGYDSVGLGDFPGFFEEAYIGDRFKVVAVMPYSGLTYTGLRNNGAMARSVSLNTESTSGCCGLTHVHSARVDSFSTTVYNGRLRNHYNEPMNTNSTFIFDASEQALEKLFGKRVKMTSGQLEMFLWLIMADLVMFASQRDDRFGIAGESGDHLCIGDFMLCYTAGLNIGGSSPDYREVTTSPFISNSSSYNCAHWLVNAGVTHDAIPDKRMSIPAITAHYCDENRIKTFFNLASDDVKSSEKLEMEW